VKSQKGIGKEHRAALRGGAILAPMEYTTLE